MTSVEEAEEYAASIGASFMETSAKDKTNVDELFANISKALPEHVAPAQPYNSLKLNAKTEVFSTDDTPTGPSQPAASQISCDVFATKQRFRGGQRAAMPWSLNQVSK